MCGILFTFLSSDTTLGSRCDNVQDLQGFLHNRGPNSHDQLRINNAQFNGYVLWQQGSKLTPQPVETNNFILLFNGDLYNPTKSSVESDTQWLATQLENTENEQEILNQVKKWQGPYSMIFYDKSRSFLYFMRDSLGRNSLLIERDGNILRILSVSCIRNESVKTIELPPLGLFKIDLRRPKSVELFPWKSIDRNALEELKIIESITSPSASSTIILRDSILPNWMTNTGVRQPRFQFHEILKLFKPTKENVFQQFLDSSPHIVAVSEELLNRLKQSVKDRVQNTPKFCVDCIKNITGFSPNGEIDEQSSCHHTKIGILFSGGVDCTIIAALANEFVNENEPVDLINVAFQKYSSTTAFDWNVPDRVSAEESLNDLRRLHPLRKWNLVKVNVKRSDLNEKLDSHIKHLIYPLQTVLDESLGCAFWFAANGKGFVDGIPYQSPCRVILIGSGADELFGGYVRHRNTFLRAAGNYEEKIEMLRAELQFDWLRIPMRNLGRDDRVIADCGKTARAPFVEENLANFVTGLHAMEKCCFELEQGIGDKLILRIVAHRLGLTNSCHLKKRAIQFGSRIANKNQNAKDLSQFLT